MSLDKDKVFLSKLLALLFVCYRHTAFSCLSLLYLPKALEDCDRDRAEEERDGLIRWLRPEYQAPEETQTQQVTPEVLPTEEPIIEPVEQQKWPTKPKEQFAAIRDLLRTTPGEWTTQQIAAQFKGNITKKKLDAISENCDRLEWFGLIVSETKGDIPHWHYAESVQAA